MSHTTVHPLGTAWIASVRVRASRSTVYSTLLCETMMRCYTASGGGVGRCRCVCINYVCSEAKHGLVYSYCIRYTW